MLKKIIILIIISICYFNFVQAKEAIQVELNSSIDKLAVGDTFQVSIEIKNASTEGINMENIVVPGIDDFQQIASSQSTKIEIINGATSAVFQTNLTLVAVSTGEYKLGPVVINGIGASTTSNVVNILVDKKEKKSFFQNNVKDKNEIVKKSSNKQFNVNYQKIIINIFIFVLLIFMIYVFSQREKNIKFRNQEEEIVPEQKESKIKLPNKNDEKYFEKIKFFILEYLQSKYKIDTEILTSDEIIEELRQKKIISADFFKEALALCDQGNFAKDDSVKDKLINITKNIFKQYE